MLNAYEITPAQTFVENIITAVADL